MVIATVVCIDSRQEYRRVRAILVPALIPLGACPTAHTIRLADDVARAINCLRDVPAVRICHALSIAGLNGGVKQSVVGIFNL